MKVENFIFSPSCLVTQPCSFFVGLSLLQRWKCHFWYWITAGCLFLLNGKKRPRWGDKRQRLSYYSFLFSDDNLLLLMTDTFSYLLFPKLFCPKKLSLVTKTLTGPFFMCGIEAFCLFLRTNCIKGFLMFRLHQDILHSIDLSEKMIACHITWRIGKLSCVPNFDSVPSSLPKPF